MAEPTPDSILAGNIAAARIRRRLQQADLADRMRALGWKWVRQTVGEVENDRRRLTTGEILALAICLQTSVTRLMSPLREDEQIKLPSGRFLGVTTVEGYVTGEWVTDERVTWAGNTPIRTPPASEYPREDVDG